MLSLGFLSEMAPREALAARVDACLDHVARTEPKVVAQMKRHLQALAHAAIAPELVAAMDDAYRASLASPELNARLAALLADRSQAREQRRAS
jgi:enoyl-CoA hydratase/carnithine racemase